MEDYYISALSQCDGKQGVCPDERIGGKNDAILRKKTRFFQCSYLVNIFLSATVTGDRKQGVTYVKYKRFLQTNEPVNDQAFPTDREINVIAAIGPINGRGEANAHSHTGVDHTTDDVKIDFSSKDEHSCTSSLYDRKDENVVKPWPSRILSGENTITARIGPTGGKRGYTAITGKS